VDIAKETLRSRKTQFPGRSAFIETQIERLPTIDEKKHRKRKALRLVPSSNCSPRVLSDFRSAIDNIRQTAWAVQQWIELQQQDRDPYSVLGILSVERVRRATQITKDLTIDLESMEVSLETGGLADLFSAVESLQLRLAPLFKKQ
jgi:hypothetical protein